MQDNRALDGWRAVYTCGTTYWEMWDEGVFIIRCTRKARDNILEWSGLPLKLITSEITGLITDL